MTDADTIATLREHLALSRAVCEQRRVEIERLTRERDEADREVDRLHGQFSEILERITTIADESSGPYPVQSASESLTVIERDLHALRNDPEAAELARVVEQRDEARAEQDRTRKHLDSACRLLREFMAPASRQGWTWAGSPYSAAHTLLARIEGGGDG